MIGKRAGIGEARRVRADRSAAINPYLDHLDDAQRRALVDAIQVLRGLLDDAQQDRRSK